MTGGTFVAIWLHIAVFIRARRSGDGEPSLWTEPPASDRRLCFGVPRTTDVGHREPHRGLR
ncbi:hypothetical protein SAY86_017922 [Trapa natans]|uniref:Uncharacterized protein n=1 Tax=Trapa natans TaxID=22666 RepID=A0AAN7LLB1_TRANT|nr:hypothetical protein SAY86_017922 [Trapa natans]